MRIYNDRMSGLGELKLERKREVDLQANRVQSERMRISKSGREHGHANIVQAITPMKLVTHSLKMVISRHVNCS